MLLPVWPHLHFWYYLAIISSPSWFFSFLAMDFMKKTTGLPSIVLISTLVLSWSAGNIVLSKKYFWLLENQETDRFFRGYESAGKTIGYAVLFFGNVGLHFLPEKSVACLLTFLSLALFCLCTLFCIQPYTDFGALDFLLGASLNQTLSFFGIRSGYTWLVIIVCVVIAGIRYRLEPMDPPGDVESGPRTDASPSLELITLKSSDGKAFEVEKVVALEFQAIKHKLGNHSTSTIKKKWWRWNCAGSVIPLPNVTSKILAKVIEYCKKHVETPKTDGRSAEDELKTWDADFVEAEQHVLFDLMAAAKYLDIKSLLYLTSQTCADLTKGKTPEQIRQTFNIKNDFSPEEEEEIRRETSWKIE